ncbi:MAG TPA: IPT/TIG domain-containing protein, partial [Planctomycetota bacterium]|nr:IPT/TIG domain-containing protein [Planctomycetota bacterium]
IQAAELAILGTPGTVADKLMAAMEAARSFGGDGRCSCSAAAPTSCGSPPPSFTKAAHIGLMIVARPGDLDPPCNGGLGCAAGQYYMDFNIANQQATDPDPVLQLQALYNTWRAQQVGRPDHFQSTVSINGTSLRSNGVDTLTGTVVLRDAQGNARGNSLPVTVGLNLHSTVTGVTFGPAIPQANGSYTFTMQGHFDAGTAIVDVAVDDGLGRVVISPLPVVQVSDAFGPCGAGAIGNGAGGVIDALRVDGSAGDDRVTMVGYAQPFSLSLDPPVGVPAGFPVGMFALWAHVGLPAPGTELPLGPAAGSLCFTPAPFAPAPTLLLADSFGLGSFFSGSPAPWSLTVPGVPVLLDVTLQAAMIVDPLPSFGASNVVYLRVVPLPVPTISTIAPQSPTPGQLVIVQGTNFFSGMEGSVAGTATPITVISPTEVRFTMPAGVPCDSTLSLHNAGGPSVQRPINPTPVVSGQTLTSGPAAGGSSIVLFGQNLLNTSVVFNGAPMTITTQLTNVIIGLTPPGMPGPATILITNPNGCQTTRSFTYL